MGLSAYNPGKITGGGIVASNISYSALTDNVYSASNAQSFGTGPVVAAPTIDAISFDGPLYTEADMLESTVVEVTETEKKPWYEYVFDAVASTAATVTVAATSALSGVVNLGEKALDGAAHIAAFSCSVLGLEEQAQDVRDFISRDLSGELNEAFYEGTALGQAINDASALKYNSDLAKSISTYAEKAATIAAATALSVASGGMAGPVVAGFLVGSGSSAESNYKNGQTSGWDEFQIIVNGALTSLSWTASADLGKGVASIYNEMSSAGFAKTFASVAKDVVNPKFALDALKAGSKKGMNYVNTLFYVSDDVAGYLTGEREVNPGNVVETLGSAAWYFASTSYISSFKGYITEQGKLKITTPEQGDSLASDIKNGNKKLTDIFQYNKNAQKEILSKMSPQDLANALKDVKNSQVPQIYNLLDASQKTDLLNTIAQNIIDKPDATLGDLLQYGNNFTNEVLANLTPAKAAELRRSIGIDVLSGTTDINEVLKLGPTYIEAVKRSLPSDVQEEFSNIINNATLHQQYSGPFNAIYDHRKDIGGILDNDSKLETIETLGDALFGDSDQDPGDSEQGSIVDLYRT